MMGSSFSSRLLFPWVSSSPETRVPVSAQSKGGKSESSSWRRCSLLKTIGQNQPRNPNYFVTVPSNWLIPGCQQ